MKKATLLILLFTAAICSLAQNVGIGTSEPVNPLHIEGNFLVTAPTKGTNAQPSPGQTIVMEDRSTISVALTDSVVRIYDPGGASGNYLLSQLCNFSFFAFAGLPLLAN
jgi:hypothetical protein